MGKSAKFYKRPTRKEKMGLSSNSATVRSAIASSKFNQPEPTVLPKHERKLPTPLPSNQPYSLIQNHPVNQEDVEMEMETEGETTSKKKRKDLKSKINKKLNDSDAQSPQKLDYIDLYDKPDRRQRVKHQ